MTIQEFIRRCDAYCDAHRLTRRRLSKRLLADTYWLEKIAADDAGLSVKRFERAVEDLKRLERGEHVDHSASKAKRSAQQASVSTVERHDA